MPASLSFEQHTQVVSDSGRRLASLAGSAGLDAPVPTCPTWTAAHLVAHQAMVHRWAASHVRGEGGEARSQTEIREQEPDLLGYYRDGLTELVQALSKAPADLKAMTFLADVSTPREFWARRQAHETTIHMVDAVAAKLERVPRADEADVPVEVAVDGIDELLRGFYSRGKAKLPPGAFVVAPTDSPRRWVVTVAEKLTVTDDGPGDEVSGTAAQLYLGLWNRGDEITASGDFVERWRAAQRIRWS